MKYHPVCFDKADSFMNETVYDWQFDWGGGLLKSNGGAQR